jgi:glycosyltransferase involved in cell wall biosynthesis
MFLGDVPDARERVILTLVGPEDKSTMKRVRALGLEGIVVSVGQTNYQESLRYIHSANVCLLVEADIPEGIFLPSKLVDYISARKPVLALSPRVGEIADLVPGGGITRVDAGDAPGIRDAIRVLYEDFRKGTLALRSPSDAQVEQFSPELVGKRFLETVRELVAVKKESKLQRS